jgi:DUF2924 family protein
MHDSILAQLAALPGKTTPELKQLWRELYDREARSFNRDFLIKRLAYRIQELAYGGLSARAEAKLRELIAEEEARLNGKLPVRKGDRPIAGTRLIREWQGVEHCATVLKDGFEYQGQKYKSLSAIARAVTGTRWNGPLWFGLRNHRSAK